MDITGAIEELERMKKELRRLKFQVEGPTRTVIGALERLVDRLLKRAKKVKI